MLSHTFKYFIDLGVGCISRYIDLDVYIYGRRFFIQTSFVISYALWSFDLSGTGLELYFCARLRMGLTAPSFKRTGAFFIPKVILDESLEM